MKQGARWCFKRSTLTAPFANASFSLPGPRRLAHLVPSRFRLVAARYASPETLSRGCGRPPRPRGCERHRSWWRLGGWVTATMQASERAIAPRAHPGVAARSRRSSGRISSRRWPGSVRAMRFDASSEWRAFTCSTRSCACLITRAYAAARVRLPRFLRHTPDHTGSPCPCLALCWCGTGRRCRHAGAGVRWGWGCVQ